MRNTIHVVTIDWLQQCGLVDSHLLAGFDNYHVYENLSYGSEKQNVMDVYVPETEICPVRLKDCRSSFFLWWMLGRL